MSAFTSDASLAYRRVLVFFAATSSPVFLASGLFGYLFFIYATDTLLLAPAAIGTLIAASKVYDGVSDLIMGSWSDRTRSRFGRRRPFILIGGIVTLSYCAIWLPPENFSNSGTLAWIAIMLILWETGSTLIGVPYTALVIETGQTPSKRTAVNVLGAVLGLPGTLGAIFLMQHLLDSGDARNTGTMWFIAIGVGLSAIVVLAGASLKELPLGAAEPDRNMFKMLRDVMRVHYHTRLLGVQMVESFAFTSVAFMVPYVMTYIVEEPEKIMWVFLIYLLAGTFAKIGWWAMISRWGMKRIWMTGLWMWVGVFAIFPTVFVFGTPAFLTMAAFAGIASGAASVNFAMLGDVADYDARQSGHQRQGVYVTIYRLVSKIAGAAVAFALGWTLQLSGFVPNQPQAVATIVAITISISLLPMVATLWGLRWLKGYDFYDKEGISDGPREFMENGTLDDLVQRPASA